MTLKEAETLALSTLKAVMEEKVSTVNVDMACVSPAYKVYSKEDIKAIIETVSLLSRAALAPSSAVRK